MTHVVILGAGIAGVTAAYALKARLGLRDEVTVVSDKSYFHFVPSNPWVAMGWRERSDIAFPIEPYFSERGIKFIASGASRIQPDVRQIDLVNGDVVFYDILLIATGSTGMSNEIPGLAKHTHSVCHIESAEQTLAAYRDFLRHPGPIVLGAAPGASVLGPLYEYAFLLDADLRRRNIRGKVPIMLVTPEPWPGHLGLGEEGPSRGAVTAAMADIRVGAICNARTVRIDQDTLHVVELDAAGNEKHIHALPYAFSVFWHAQGGVAAVRNAVGLVNERGLVVVDEYLRNPTYPNVFAIGACVAHEPLGPTPVPVGAPDSVYSISKAGDIAVRNILAQLGDATLMSYAPERARWLSDMGMTGASYLSEPQVPLREINWMRQGRWVHQAKIDFEKYFINKIRLMPAGHAPSLPTWISGLMGQLLAGKAEGPAPASSPNGGQSLEIQLPRDPACELMALARTLGREPEVLAAELLTAALADARICLSDSAVEALAYARRELLVAGLPKRQPGVEFHGSGT